MRKDPAILWYPSDWISGTMGMTFEQKGAYMELLMAQFSRGHMTSHMIGHMVGQIWDTIKDKFVQDEKGLYYNERLEIEKTRRKNFVKSRKNNLYGNNQYTKKDKNLGHMGGHMGGHTTSHMVNENIYIYIDSTKIYSVYDFIVENEYAFLENLLMQHKIDMQGVCEEFLRENSTMIYENTNHLKRAIKKFIPVFLEKQPKKKKKPAFADTGGVDPMEIVTRLNREAYDK